MKEGWERHKEVFSLTKDDIQEMIKRYDSSLEVVRYEQLSGGLSHTNYKVFHQESKKPLVVRISKDHRNMMQEYNLHGLLSDNKTVPEFYRIGGYQELAFGILEWKEGVLLKDKLFTYSSQEIRKAGYSLGRHLGNLRNIRFEAPGFLGADLNVTEFFELTPIGFLKTMRYFLFEGKVVEWLDGVTSEELMAFCNKHAELFLLDNSGPRLVHGDFNGLNILMDDQKVSAILDWEFAMSGSMYFDLGNLLRYENLPHFQELERGVYEGLLESGEELPKEWRRLARLADLVSLCSMLDNGLGGANRVRDINRLIRGTIFCGT